MISTKILLTCVVLTLVGLGLSMRHLYREIESQYVLRIKDVLLIGSPTLAIITIIFKIWIY